MKIITNKRATKCSIYKAVEWLCSKAAPGRVLLFSYSGQGIYGPDVQPIDEVDGYDEYIYPYDSLADSYKKTFAMLILLGTFQNVVRKGNCSSNP